VNITAVNVEGSISSGSFSVRTGPGAPSAISQSETTTTGFKISWTPGTGATSYTFTVNGSPVTPTIVGNTATFTGLSPSVSYSIVVISVKGGLSSPSAAFDATTSEPPPTTPVVIQTADTNTSVTIAWTGGVGATSYSFTLDGAAATPTVNGSTATFTELATDTEYTIVVTATNSFGSTPSAGFTALTDTPLISGRMLFPGIGGQGLVIQTAGDEDFTISTNNFTFEFYVYSKRLAGISRIFKFEEGGTYFTFDIENGIIRVYNSRVSFGPIITYGVTSLINTWAHMALVRIAGNLTLYVNGTPIITVSDTSNLLNLGPLVIGGANGLAIDGYITNFHYAKSFAKYRNAFTPDFNNHILPESGYTKLLLLSRRSNTLLSDSSGLSKTVGQIGSGSSLVTWAAYP
jgi:hypothetical protein